MYIAFDSFLSTLCQDWLFQSLSFWYLHALHLKWFSFITEYSCASAIIYSNPYGDVRKNACHYCHDMILSSKFVYIEFVTVSIEADRCCTYPISQVNITLKSSWYQHYLLAQTVVRISMVTSDLRLERFIVQTSSILKKNSCRKLFLKITSCIPRHFRS